MNLKNSAHIIKLIAPCIKGERSAQNALYKMFYSYGMSVSTRYVNNREDAILILNDGFLKVFKNLKNFNTDLDFKPWFKTIVVNTAINHIRKMKKFDSEVEIDEARTHTNNESILNKINYQELLEMVQSLSLAYRTVFNMYVIDGFKHNEIAEELGISVSTSKSNLTRAKEKLRKMIINKQLI